MIRKVMFIFACVIVFSISVVSAQDTPPTFVLVHGAFQDASGWAGVVANLEAEGYTTVTVELAGRGEDTTPLGEITLDNYRDAVIEVIEAQEQPVILVGHSFGGITISSVAEAIPDRIQALVYLSAYLPRTEESLVSLSAQDHYSVLGQEGNFILAEDFTYAAVLDTVFASAFCPDCNEEQLAAVAASQLNEPLAPLNTPVTLTPENFGSVRKVYILTSQDVVVSPQLQALMIANTPVDHVYALDAGHAAYIIVPDALAAILIEAASAK